MGWEEVGPKRRGVVGSERNERSSRVDRGVVAGRDCGRMFEHPRANRADDGVLLARLPAAVRLARPGHGSTCLPLRVQRKSSGGFTQWPLRRTLPVFGSHMERVGRRGCVRPGPKQPTGAAALSTARLEALALLQSMSLSPESSSTPPRGEPSGRLPSPRRACPRESTRSVRP